MRRKPGRTALAATSILCSLILAACNCAPTLRYVSVAPASSATIFATAVSSTSGTTTTTTITPCTTQQFAATAYYSDGSQKDISSVAGWGSSNTSTATINATGLASVASTVTATGGTSVITATSGGASGTASLAVNVLTAIAVTPATATVPLGGTQQYMATGTFTTPGSSAPTTMDLTTQVAWSVTGGTASSDGSTNSNSNATIGTATGLLTSNGEGQSQGTTNVIATLCTLSGTTPVTIGPPTAQILKITPVAPSIAVGQTVDFIATIINTDGSTSPVAGPVTWSSDNTSFASIISKPVSPWDGLATGIAAGTANIGASYGTDPNIITGTTTLTVSPAVARFAYVANGLDSSISGYAPHAASGAFNSLGKISATQPQQVVIHPSGMFLYSVDGDTGPTTITAYSIDPVGGALTNSGVGGSIPGGTDFNRAVIDPSGRWLYATDHGLNMVFAFSINQSTGALTAIGAGVATGTGPIDVLVTPNDSYLYVINNGANSVSAYTIGATGALTAATGPTTVLNGPLFGAIDPTGTYLFVPDAGDNTVVTFTIAADGSLTAGTPFPVTGAIHVQVVAVDPTSKFLYTVDSPGGSTGNGNLYALSIGAGGVLTATINTGNPYPLGKGPTGVYVDPTGKIVEVANSFDNTLSVFTAAADGSLTADSLVETGSAPQFAVFAKGTAEASVSLAAVVAANSVPGTLSAFTINSSGATAVNTTPFASVAGNNLLAGSGSSVFTSSATAMELGGYTVDPTSATATFTQLAAPVSTTGTANGVAVDATGSYIYVADSTTNVVRSFTNTNPFTEVAPPAASAGLLALATDPQTTLVYGLGTNTITPIRTQATTGVLVSQTPLSMIGTWAAGAVSPGGKFLAAVDSATNKIQIFTITPVTGAGPALDGKLTPIGSGVSIPGAMAVSSVAFDPLGRFLVVTDWKANTVTPFTISSSGTLTAGTAFTTPTGAYQAAFDPNGLGFAVAVFGNPTATPAVPGGVQIYQVGTDGTIAAVGTPVSAGNGTTGVAGIFQVQ
jgi:6-phosphogluconolactonase (cycloisomerase 2 family)